ncbi:CTD kinase subunit gamma [Entomortierella parvispora]|uniref:CTD kinase subunit gamma n=1 Tax=Entomortierella parvispora TaxID=205924 RepID=A0A9P3HFH4_9FUNG|nr:CTD kinase subunit gamma [Entomortierella parvispora]
MDVDPFEARMEFLGLLGKLNASQHSILKVGNFAMRNRNLYEDLYSCITEELEKTPSINARMNILYVLDSICQQSLKAHFAGYTDLLQRGLSKVIDLVAPAGAKGNVNVAGTKKILEMWKTRKIFPANVLDKVMQSLSSRDLGASVLVTSDTGFSKDDILRRMDEDRERHKRIREEIWIRPPEEAPEDEFLESWNDTSDIEDVDYEDMECENEKYLAGYPWPLEFDRFLPSPALLRQKNSSSTSSSPAAASEPSPTLASSTHSDAASTSIPTATSSSTPLSHASVPGHSSTISILSASFSSQPPPAKSLSSSSPASAGTATKAVAASAAAPTTSSAITSSAAHFHSSVVHRSAMVSFQ